MLAGDLPARALLDLALAALPRETHQLNIARILADLEWVYWIYTAQAERPGRAAEVDRVLRTGVGAATTAMLKHTWFAALHALASTPETTEWLTHVWRGDEMIPGLALVDRDLISLAQALAVRDAPSSGTMLRQQIARTVDPDRQAALRFVAPALSADPAERDRFFASLADVANRRHERWVIDGLRCLHHPLRAASALVYIEPSLELLETIQQTGDIFFPARWITATLWGHASVEAAAIVRGFLDRAPLTYRVGGAPLLGD
jgi:aminopeptidase N